MANYNFQLKKSKLNKKGEAPLLLTYSHGYKSKIQIGIGVSVNPDHLTPNFQVKNADKKYRLKNKKINEARSKISDIIIKLEVNEIEPTVEIVKAKFNEQFGKKTTVKKEAQEEQPNGHPLIKHFIEFIKLTKNGERKYKGNVYSANTIKSYMTTLKYLIAFQGKMKKELTFNDMNKSFYASFVDYIFNPKNEVAERYKNLSEVKDSSVDKHIKNLKTFLQYGLEEEWHKNYDFKTFFKRIDYDNIPYAINPKMLNDLIDKQMEDKNLEKAKDVFLFQIGTCLRISDLMSLGTDNISLEEGEYIINVYPKKTLHSSGKKVKAPLPSFAIEILEKYRGKLKGDKILPTWNDNKEKNEQDYNEALKKMAKVMNWDKIKVEQFKRVKGAPEIYYVPLNEFISSHLARKSGVSILLALGAKEIDVRELGGFSVGSKAFAQYVAIHNDWKRSGIIKAWKKLRFGKPKRKKKK